MAKHKKHVDNDRDPQSKNPEYMDPELKYYRDQLSVVADWAEKSSRLRYSFFQHILLVSSSVLSILISLHQKSSPYIYIHLVFLLSLLLFALGILCAGIVLYDHSLLPGNAQKEYSEEVQQAINEGRKANHVNIQKKKRTLLLEKLSLIMLLSGLFVLIIHEILISFL